MYQTQQNSSYLENTLNLMSKGEKLVFLYDQAIKFLEMGKLSIQENDDANRTKCLEKGQRIINYLNATLDRAYPISKNLSQLYDYFAQRVVSANIGRKLEPLDEIIPMITELRDTFAQADKNARMQKLANSPKTTA